MIEFEVNGINYRSTQLNVKKQLHVARRLAPFIGMVGGTLAGPNRDAVMRYLGWAPPDDTAPPSDDSNTVSIILTALVEAVSKLSDEDTDYVIDTCLSAVQRQTAPSNWVPVTNGSGGIMFNDLKLPAVMKIVFKVIQDNLSGFTQDPVST